jgi:hypothetical protein
MASKSRNRAATTEPATQPDDSLLALDSELSRGVLELELLRLRRGPSADADFERDIQSRLGRISELYGAIAVSQPTTLAGAAVLLRRVPAMLDDDHDVDPGHLALASQLIDTALAVVEKNAF